MSLNPLILTCHLLPEFEDSDWDSVDCAFASRLWCKLQQAWRPTPELGFQPARVRIGWQNDALWVDAHLSDLDIFNGATHLNDATYAKGDIFEIFVRPASQNDYFEFHITPENHNLQLHWPDDKAVWSCEDTQRSLAPYFVAEPLLQSRTRVEHEDNRWRVLARVPLSIASSGSGAGDSWMFSFSRYDCTRGVAAPVHSSSSPHAEPRFHRQQEWGRLYFASC